MSMRIFENTHLIARNQIEQKTIHSSVQSKVQLEEISTSKGMLAYSTIKRAFQNTTGSNTLHANVSQNICDSTQQEGHNIYVETCNLT